MEITVLNQFPLQCAGWKISWVQLVGSLLFWKLPLIHFLFQLLKAGEDLNEAIDLEKGRKCKQVQAFCGDSVFKEIAAARGCLGRFSGGEMMGIRKTSPRFPQEKCSQRGAVDDASRGATYYCPPA